MNIGKISQFFDHLSQKRCTYFKIEGGNRQNRLHLESRTLSWARLWTFSYMPSIYGNNIPTGKLGPPDCRTPGLIPLGSPLPERIP